MFVFFILLVAFTLAKSEKKKEDTESYKDITLPDSVIKSKLRVARRLEQQLKMSSADAKHAAESILSSIDETAINPTLERAKAVASKVKKAAKVTEKHMKGKKLCGDELINLAKMYDDKIKVPKFDMTKLNDMIDAAVKKYTVANKMKKVKCMLKKAKREGLKIEAPKSDIKRPLKLTLAQQYPQIAKLIPETDSFIDFKEKENAKQMIQNKLIKNN
ncbi:hypothetical protein EIN_430590 [Entamoeba invadens IP1]|uniref:Uncharacterized protein n=2 Tax=Entamoeba invadens TaxID=33085 RepID=A0A0A1UFH0_ENTIV|nr:hypothetical protein EIN_430590 [Entamoeba invadens IP1]ELP95253.1 hypothetical protein EIN_430590 [Entamoeba invadens IP1]BAN41174.1 hypothetical protein [Entamoeba invadens]BAN41763.1 hypothetical protein [Entamoeba invadens]BAN42211.1 hypothetical protein [Entamoeba invadens]|eukprot:XP_004262024.1 hypothetical protein EIN_430590 [Entamoeba invadens IP1]